MLLVSYLKALCTNQGHIFCQIYNWILIFLMQLEMALFLTYISDFSLRVYRCINYFCIFILYPAALSNLLISSHRLFRAWSFNYKFNSKTIVKFIGIKLHIIFPYFPLIPVKSVPMAPLTLSVQFSSVAQSCPTLCDPMNPGTPGLPVHHQLLEFTQTHVHRVGDAIQPSHPLSSPSPPAFNISQHQGLFQWVSSSHQVAKVLEFQLQHQSFQWTPRTDFL